MHVTDHLFTAILAEVDVDIWHRDPVRVEKSLEDQIVLERAEVGDTEAVGDDRSNRRSATRADRYSLTSGVPAEVPGDQEIGDKTHLDDHRDLVLEAFSGNIGWVWIEVIESFLDQFAEPNLVAFLKIFRSLGFRGTVRILLHEDRQEGLARLHLEIDHRCDIRGVGDVLGVISKDASHLIAASEVEGI